VDNIFGKRKDGWSLTAAISGVHSVGSAKKQFSGYEGHWSDAAQQGKFNNNYYHSVLLSGWGPERAVNGNKKKN